MWHNLLLWACSISSSCIYGHILLVQHVAAAQCRCCKSESPAGQNRGHHDLASHSLLIGSGHDTAAMFACAVRGPSVSASDSFGSTARIQASSSKPGSMLDCSRSTTDWSDPHCNHHGIARHVPRRRLPRNMQGAFCVSKRHLQ